jgi:hypothetical protein
LSFSSRNCSLSKSQEKRLRTRKRKKKGNELHQKRKHPNCVNWNNRLEKQRKKEDFELSILAQNAKQNKTKKYIKSIKKI